MNRSTLLIIVAALMIVLGCLVLLDVLLVGIYICIVAYKAFVVHFESVMMTQLLLT